MSAWEDGKHAQAGLVLKPVCDLPCRHPSAILFSIFRFLSCFPFVLSFLVFLLSRAAIFLVLFCFVFNFSNLTMLCLVCDHVFEIGDELT